MKARKSRSKYAQVRHLFLYKLQLPDGGEKLMRHAAKVVHATEPVALQLDAGTVERSMKIDGAGNTAKCSGSVCIYEHRDLFPHPVIGWTDFTYSRAFIASKLDSHGLPSECVAYEHDNNAMARLNDGPDGHKKLLAKIRKYGPITLRLKPYRPRSEVGRPGAHRATTGVRSPLRRIGANLRFAVLVAGSLPT
jgi:hypothetical protein